MSDNMWTLLSARMFITSIEEAVQAVGYHIGLTGSVLNRGESSHDLDLIFYPASTVRQDVDELESVLKKAGLEKRFDKAFIQKVWRKKGSQDTKHVESWLDIHKRRIDIFLLS